jgi:hypothetical protein
MKTKAMKTKLTIGAAMLLTLGSALAGGLMLQKDGSGRIVESTPIDGSVVDAREVTPEMIARWKATAATSDYSPPMLPI